MNDLNFIPDLHQDTSDKPNFRCRTFEKWQETVLQRAGGGMSTHFSGSPGFRKIIAGKRNSTILAVWSATLTLADYVRVAHDPGAIQT
jgi:hypothetical protein